MLWPRKMGDPEHYIVSGGGGERVLQMTLPQAWPNGRIQNTLYTLQPGGTKNCKAMSQPAMNKAIFNTPPGHTV